MVNLSASSIFKAAAPAISAAKRMSTILVAFDHACNEEDYEVAHHLLTILEIMDARAGYIAPDNDWFGLRDRIVEAHERLWTALIVEFPKLA
jgi:hypothetical protein